jgi:hypothetical protein
VRQVREKKAMQSSPADEHDIPVFLQGRKDRPRLEVRHPTFDKCVRANLRRMIVAVTSPRGLAVAPTSGAGYDG